AAEALVGELAAAEPLEVGLARARSGIERRTLEATPAALAPGSQQLGRLEKGDVVLVTGGARGVTAEVALALARAAQPVLVLLGRSPEPSAEPAWLTAAQDEGAIKRALLGDAQSRGETPAPRALGE